MGNLRLGFAGTPEFAARILKGLLEHGRRPLIVYTQPDRPFGRGRRVRTGPVKQLAEDAGIETLQPINLRDPDIAQQLAGLGLDVLVVAAYGLLLPPAILAAPTQGCINVHASLLPRWRGAAPVERAIMAGDTQTGVSIMRMERGLDTGPVYLTRDCAIDSATTGPALEARLADIGTAALLACLDALPDIEPTPQSGDGVCYAQKLTTADARVDWLESALDIDRRVRALSGRLPAYTFAGSTRVQILEATPDSEGATGAAPGTIVAASGEKGIQVACGAGVLIVTRLQVARGKGQPLLASQALNGFPELLGSGRELHGEPC